MAETLYEKTKLVKVYTCLRCGHEWEPRRDEKPGSCPNFKCRSPHWDTPRKPEGKRRDKQNKS